MSDFKTIAEKLLVFCDYKHVSEVDADIEKLLELYENLQKENELLRKKAQLIDDMAKDMAESADKNIIRLLGGEK